MMGFAEFMIVYLIAVAGLSFVVAGLVWGAVKNTPVSFEPMTDEDLMVIGVVAAATAATAAI